MWQQARISPALCRVSSPFAFAVARDGVSVVAVAVVTIAVVATGSIVVVVRVASLGCL